VPHLQNKRLMIMMLGDSPMYTSASHFSPLWVMTCSPAMGRWSFESGNCAVSRSQIPTVPAESGEDD
jgi:hypothetical protein